MNVRAQYCKMNVSKKRALRALSMLVIVMALIGYLFPVYWIVSTSFKSRQDAFSIPPKIFRFDPTLENYKSVFVVENEYLEALGEQAGQVGSGETQRTNFARNFLNSVLISGSSVALAIVFGTLCAYGLSRFRMRGKNDVMFYILSNRMLPPVVVIIPIYLMYRSLNLIDTYQGMILLYTAFNLPFVVWMMKGFLDEIPREYEEAAMVDGYTRMQAFWKVVLPQAWTGIAATAVFSLITVWNEFVFSLIMTAHVARTAPPTIVGAQVLMGTDWGQIAAASTIFLVPVFIFIFLVRKHLLRGVTFGMVRNA